LTLEKGASLELLATPVQFTSPVSFSEDDLEQPVDEVFDDEADEETEEEDLEEIEEGI